MNILILGLGSIGQRHLRNLKKISPKTNIFALRKKYLTPMLNNNNRIVKGDLKKKYSLKYINNLNEIKKKKLIIDAALICTPSSHHVTQAIWLIKNNIHCFVEKPLGSSSKNILKLKKLLIRKPNLITMMGFQLRFNPIIHYIEKILRNSPIGKIHFINIHHGEHVEDFHPYEDYKISYASKKKLGGGVMLSQIHEIDYFLYLFKSYKIKKINSLNSKISNLKIDVEDIFSSIFVLKKNNQKIFCTINLNFFERPKKRKIYLVGSMGSIKICLNSQKVEIYKNKIKYIKNFDFNRNDIFKKELKFFLNCIQKKKKISDDMNLFNGIKTLNFVLKLKKKSI